VVSRDRLRASKNEIVPKVGLLEIEPHGEGIDGDDVPHRLVVVSRVGRVYARVLDRLDREHYVLGRKRLAVREGHPGL
jgi:hypothetical protein